MPYGHHTATCHSCGKRYQCGDSISQECDECLMERTRTDMSEQIQVRPGRWRMRNGEVIERVEPHETQSAYRWKGKGPDGFQYTWQDDGRFSVGDCERPADLVEFLGDPEPDDVDKFAAFKSLVHSALDELGIPTHNGEECRIKGRLHDLIQAVRCGWDEHDGWIPIDPALGGRLPTEEDANLRGAVLGQYTDGQILPSHWQYVGNNSENFVAWMPLPKPFVPPAKVEEPKRLEGYFVMTTNIPMMTWRGPYMDEQVSLADDRPLTPQKFWREVRSGDVDPDAARRLVEDVNWTLVLAALREHWHGKAPMSMSTLEDRLAACRRKAASENVR